MHARVRTALGFALVLLAGGAPGCRSPGSAPLPDDPELALQRVEERLLEARSVRCFTHMSAEGVRVADLRSEHQLAPDGRTRVRVRGTFDGREVDTTLESDGERMRVVGVQPAVEMPAQAEVFEGFVIGLTRMGWMHNAARLVAGAGPEGCGGGVREWVQARDVRIGDEVELNGVKARALVFDVVVGGDARASAILWVASESGLPLLRLQRVQFPEGEMRVSEYYEQLELNGRMEF